MDYSIIVTNVRFPFYSCQTTSFNKEKQVKNIISQCDLIFLKEIHLVIEQNLNNAEFSNKELAKKLHISVSQLFRKLKTLTKKSTSNYIRGIRLSNAARMLKDSKFNIAEIAFMTGFNDPSYFTRAFVKELGITPRKFREDSRK